MAARWSSKDLKKRKGVRRKGKKYGNKRTLYNGRYYDSKAEANHAKKLDWRIKAGEVKKWEPQHTFKLEVNGHLVTTYRIDFRVVLADGSIEYHEVKGYPTEGWKIKWELTKAIWEDISEKGATLLLYKS